LERTIFCPEKFAHDHRNLQNLKLIDNFEVYKTADFSDIEIRQIILLDVVSKLRSLIEHLLILVHSLDIDNSKISYNLSYYDIQLPIQTIKNFNKYNLRKILGLCEIDKITKNIEEKKVLSRIYSQTQEYFEQKLRNLMKFYEEYRVLHGKTKHGFIIRMNATIKPLSVLSPPVSFEDSLIQALDKKANTKDILIHKKIKGSPGHSKIYNIISFLRVSGLPNKLTNG
jgi:hypothetical protein